MATTTDSSNWNFYNYHVQQELKGGQFVSAESTLVAAGPPSLQDAGNDSQTGQVYPIGLLETVGLQQSRQLQRIFEIGSSRSYFIPGRTVGSLSIGRTFYYGPSLLRVMYAYYPSAKLNNASKYNLLAPTTAEFHSVKRIAGYKDFLIDLSSDLFAQPTGMAIYFKDANSESVGAFYLEQVYVQSHQMTVSSGSVLVMEGASMQYDIITPINISESADTGKPEGNT